MMSDPATTPTTPTIPAAPGAPATAAAPAGTPAASADPATITDEQLRERVFDACKNVYDPEIPVNIFELGLIYDVIIGANRDVTVKMTLTSPSCPAAQELPLEVRGRVSVIPGVNDVDVDVVFDPPWTPARMTETARVQMGLEL